jgi:hypothetical protein
LPQAGSAGLWRQDIDALVSGLSATGTTLDFSRGIASRGQKDFARLYPAATFQPAVASLKDNAGSLPDAEIVLRLMQLMASANVAHNVIQTPKNLGFERHLPVSFGWFADGMAVIAANQPHATAVGLRVGKIGSQTPQQLLQSVAPFLSHENNVWLQAIGPGFLELQPVLNHLGLIDADGSVSVTLGSADGHERVMKLDFTASKEARVGLWAALKIPRPLFWPQPGKKYWSHYFENSQTVYVQYNECANDAAESFATFTRGVTQEIDARLVERVLIDLRWNTGGDSRVIAPLKKALASRPKTRRTHLCRDWAKHFLLGSSECNRTQAGNRRGSGWRAHGRQPQRIRRDKNHYSAELEAGRPVYVTVLRLSRQRKDHFAGARPSGAANLAGRHRLTRPGSCRHFG